MENFFAFYLIFDIFCSVLVGFVAMKKECSNGIAFLISLIFSPIIGFLYVLCSDSKEQNYQLRRQKEILSKMLDVFKGNNDKYN